MDQFESRERPLDVMNIPDGEVMADSLGLWLRVAQKRYVDAANKRFEKFRATHLDFLVLTFVSRDPGCRLMLLANQLRLKPPNVAKAVEDLVGRELLEKISDPEDRRAVRLSLTDYGARVLSDLIQEHNRLREEALQHVGVAGGDQMLVSLRAMVTALRSGASSQDEEWS